MTSRLDEEMPGEMRYLDFSKAFDSVNHCLLLKLRAFGIGGRLLKWTGELLKGRTFYFRIREANSDKGVVTSGVAAKKASGDLFRLKSARLCRKAESFVPLSKAFVRPYIEYYAQNWSPFFQKNKDCLEVQ